MNAIFSTAYFPPISYCMKLKEHCQVTIDLGEHFIKQTQRNRMYILGPNGVQKLIVPLIKWKNNTAVKDLKISYSENWQKLHWKSLEAAYRSSPYFEFYEDQLRKIILDSKFKFLHDLNYESLHFINEKGNLDFTISSSMSFVKEVNDMEDNRHLPYKDNDKSFSYKNYMQVFGNSDFVSNLSFLDLICNEGPNAIYKL